MILPYDMNELTNALWYYTYHMVHYDTGQLEVPTNSWIKSIPLI